jgi:sporulation protein YlmC with PRC-barrel domain
MSQAVEEFTMGAEVTCQDGTCGVLRRLVVDPVAQALSHLVVEPKHGHDGGHLVTIGLVESATDTEVRLRCTKAQFEALDPAEETQLMPVDEGHWDNTQDALRSLPHFRLGIGGIGQGGLGAGRAMGRGPLTIQHHNVPGEEVEIRRGEHVHATDGPIGHVRGLVIDPSTHHVSHVLLEEGHLWGEKQVAIPINDVTSVEGGVQLNLTKDQVRDLPSVEIDR